MRLRQDPLSVAYADSLVIVRDYITNSTLLPIRMICYSNEYYITIRVWNTVFDSKQWCLKTPDATMWFQFQLSSFRSSYNCHALWITLIDWPIYLSWRTLSNLASSVSMDCRSVLVTQFTPIRKKGNRENEYQDEKGITERLSKPLRTSPWIFSLEISFGWTIEWSQINAEEM